VEEQLSAQIRTFRSQLERLIAHGRTLRSLLSADPSPADLAVARVWQRECGALVNEMSGGSKAHWLARAFGDAFMARDATGAAVEEVTPGEIVGRLLAVMEQASGALAQLDAAPLTSADPPAPRRFDFVHDAVLRPVLEQAYGDGSRALERADYRLALLTYAGILEAIVTDALHCEDEAVAGAGRPPGSIADWSFEVRLEIAEKASLIGSGCARLPEAARKYRDDPTLQAEGDAAISEREARQTAQVLHVVMRDLNPGR